MGSDHRYYTVLETALGNVLTEQSVDGASTWRDTPQQRSCSAKVTRCGECTTGVTVEQLRKAVGSQRLRDTNSGCISKSYSRVVYGLVTGVETKLMEFKSLQDSVWTVNSQKAGPFPLVERKPSQYKLMATRL